MNFSIWRRNFKSLLVFTMFLTLSACAIGQGVSNYDLSTKEGVFKALESETGREYKKNSRGCLKRPKELSNIILIGGFANDRGCILTNGFVEKKFAKDRKQLTKMALKSLGWKKADSKIRQQLALNWVKNGLLAFLNPLKKATEHFGGKQEEFEGPRSFANKDGSITITLWTKRPAGMVCEDAYSKISYKFSPKGEFVERKQISSFRIPCK